MYAHFFKTVLSNDLRKFVKMIIPVRYPSFVTLTPGPVGTCRHAVPLEEKKFKAVSLLKSVKSIEVGRAFCISCIKSHFYDLQIL